MQEIDVREQCRTNPFDSELARANSAYGQWAKHGLVRSDDPRRPLSAFQQEVHGAFRSLILRSEYSCVGAKAAFNSGLYRMGVYEDMTSSGSLAGLARDLFTFVQEQPALGSDFATFAASFAGPQIMGEEAFEAHLWDVLQSLYDVDRLFHPPDPKVADDPNAANFGFSFAGCGFL